MATELIVKRETRMLMELRRGTFDVVLDGVIVGSVSRDQTFEKSIEAGHHQLQVRIGRYSSPVQSFEVADGDAVAFRCNGARIWPVYLVSLLVPSLALTLVPE